MGYRLTEMNLFLTANVFSVTKELWVQITELNVHRPTPPTDSWISNQEHIIAKYYNASFSSAMNIMRTDKVEGTRDGYKISLKY